MESDEEDWAPSIPMPNKNRTNQPERHRVKKLVKKTFVDEEGFMVTKMFEYNETDK